MSGQSRILKAEMVRTKIPKGSALKAAMATKTINNRLASITGKEKQLVKK